MFIKFSRRVGLRFIAGLALVGMLAWTNGTGPARADSLAFYVSPKGSDTNPGTASAPVRTLQAAQKLVQANDKNLSSDLTVYLEPGTYQLSAPLTLGPKDSGTNGHLVQWTAAPGATPAVTGAERISGWKQTPSNPAIWSAPVPSNLQTRQIYVDGVRATLASGLLPAHTSRWWQGYQTPGSAMSHWRNPSQIDFVYTGQLGLMAEPICPVSTIVHRLITMAQPCWENSTRRLNNYVGYGSVTFPSYIENAYELLKQPGQFYLDDHLHRLYYIPRPGQDMYTADVEAPTLQTLVEGSGTPANPVHNIRFSNIQFEGATWLRPGTPEGFSEIQAGYTLTGSHGFSREGLCHLVAHGACPFGAWTKEPGNIQFSYDQNVSFVDDEFVHLGAAAVNLDDGSQNDAIQGCVFADVSGNGIELGNVDLPAATGAQQTVGNVIEDNHLYDLGVEYSGAVGILAGYAADTTIAHNQLDDLPYTAISMGWGGWTDKISRPSVVNFSHDNVIEDNLIYNFVQKLGDGGGVYTLGLTGTSMANGEKIVGNEIYGQLNWSYALHSDDGATFVTNKNNILFDNEYDWAGNHTDYQLRKLRHKPRDPQAIVGNYWQQGDQGYSDRTVTDRYNHVIFDASQAPTSLTSQVGIEPGYQSILSWHPAGAQVPNAPTKVTAPYAFDGSVYLSWLPSFAEGDSPVTSYSVTTCLVSGNGCATDSPPVQSIPRAEYDQLGYLVIDGLTNGSHYTFTVTANSATGSSTPSLPSGIITPSSREPRVDGRVPGVYPRPGDRTASVIWWPPSNTHCPWWDNWCKNPALAYKITVLENGKDVTSYTSSSLSQLIVSNHSGRALFMVPDLQAGHWYAFMVRPWDPAGYGPAFTSGAIKIGR